MSEPLKLKAAQAEARMAIERMRAGKDGNPVKPAKPRPTKPKPRAVSKLDVLCALARDPSAGRSIFAATPSRILAELAYDGMITLNPNPAAAITAKGRMAIEKAERRKRRCKSQRPQKL